MSEKDDEKQTATREMNPHRSKTSEDKKETLDRSINASIPDHDKTQRPTLQDITSRKKGECIEALLGFYYHANMIEKKLIQNMRQCKVKGEADTKKTEGTDNAGKGEAKKLETVGAAGKGEDEKLETEGTDNAGKGEDKKLETDSVSEKVDSQTSQSEKLSSDRLEFIQTFKLLIRATLIIYKRLNPIWLRLTEELVEKFRSLESKGKGFSKSKSISMDPLAAFVNLPSSSVVFNWCK